MTHLLMLWLTTAIALLVVANLPTGVEIRGFGTALAAAFTFGILNVLVKPILALLALPLTILTLGLFSFIINAIIFALAASLVDGFRLRNGFISAIWGSLTLSLVGLVGRIFFPV